MKEKRTMQKDKRTQLSTMINNLHVASLARLSDTGPRPLFHFVGDRNYGLWFVQVWRVRVTVKAPWSPKIYSERTGKLRYFPKNGWRVRISTN
jgi:hypothetical protein